MKKVFFIALMIISFGASSQIKFGFGINQNFGNIYANNGTYEAEKFNLNPSSAGLSLSIIKMNESGWYPEFKVNFSLLSDTSILVNDEAYNPIAAEIQENKTTETIQREYDYNIAAYKTSHQTIQFTLNRKVSKYLSLGGGLALDIRKTKFNDLNGLATFDWNEESGSYLYSSDNNLSINNYSENSVHLMLPMNFRFHLPIKKHELILSNTLMLANNNHSYLHSSLIFWF